MPAQCPINRVSLRNLLIANKLSIQNAVLTILKWVVLTMA